MNPGSTALTIPTAGLYRNLDGTMVTTNLILQPFTSVVLKDLAATVNAIKKKQTTYSDIYLYPNPAADKIYVQESAVTNHAVVQIFNLLGVELYHAAYNGGAITIPAQWTNGMYIFQISNDQGVSETRFILNR
jgi:hypothetical protein